MCVNDGVTSCIHPGSSRIQNYGTAGWEQSRVSKKGCWQKSGMKRERCLHELMNDKCERKWSVFKSDTGTFALVETNQIEHSWGGNELSSTSRETAELGSDLCWTCHHRRIACHDEMIPGSPDVVISRTYHEQLEATAQDSSGSQIWAPQPKTVDAWPRNLHHIVEFGPVSPRVCQLLFVLGNGKMQTKKLHCCGDKANFVEAVLTFDFGGRQENNTRKRQNISQSHANIWFDLLGLTVKTKSKKALKQTWNDELKIHCLTRRSPGLVYRDSTDLSREKSRLIFWGAMLLPLGWGQIRPLGHGQLAKHSASYWHPLPLGSRLTPFLQRCCIYEWSPSSDGVV